MASAPKAGARRCATPARRQRGASPSNGVIILVLTRRTTVANQVIALVLLFDSFKIYQSSCINFQGERLRFQIASTASGPNLPRFSVQAPSDVKPISLILGASTASLSAPPANLTSPPTRVLTRSIHPTSRTARRLTNATTITTTTQARLSARGERVRCVSTRNF